MTKSSTMDYDDIENFIQKAINRSGGNCTPMPDDLFEHLSSSVHDRQLGVSIAYGIICAAGLIANAVVMFLLLAGGRKGATFKAPSTILIMNLAIADTLFLMSLPFSISHRMRKGWVFGNAMCKFEEGVKFLNYYASVFFITAMAIDRYIVVSRPALMKSRKAARKYMWILSAILWSMALISVIPLLVFAGVDQHGYCSIMFPRKQTIVNNPNKFYKALQEVQCIEDYLYIADEYYDGSESEVVKSGVANENNDQHSPILGTVDGEESGSDQDYMDYIEGDLGILIEDDGVVRCKHPNIPSMHAWLVWNFIIGFVIPFIIISISYALLMKMRLPTLFETHERQPAAADTVNNNIVRTTWREDSNKLISRPESDKTSKKTSQRAKLLMNVLVPCLIGAFTICWLPYHLFHLLQINGVNISEDACHITRDVTFCLAFFNSALNPILNSFFLYSFKQRLHQSKTWVSSQFRNLTKLKKCETHDASGRSSNKNEDDSMMPGEPTVMTTATGLDDEVAV